MSIVEGEAQWPSALPAELRELNTAARFHVDPDSIEAVAADFGGIIKGLPLAVFHPDSEEDIAKLLRFSYRQSRPFTVTPRGHGHSDRGQSVGTGGVTVDMRSLAKSVYRKRISVSSSDRSAPYVDVGGEQFWSEVLHATLKHGLSPRSWLDYLDLTVGGTLSVGGISGQVFRHGPQISNVYELDVITGKGEMVTCSRDFNSDLFYASLGGLGQFGVVTRARIALQPAPTKVRWVGLVYTDFQMYTRDQEYLITLDGTPGTKKGFDYIEGFFFLDHTHVDSWRSPFFSTEQVKHISALAKEHGGVYFVDAAINYDDATASTVDKDVKDLVQGLSYVPGFMFIKDLSYVAFLDRVRPEEERLRAEGQWDVPHPWLNLIVPSSRMAEVNERVFKGILRENKTMGAILVYPGFSKRWDKRMSVPVPDEEIIYKVGLLLFAMPEKVKLVLDQIDEILGFLDRNGIDAKQYMPHYENREDWVKYYGVKWEKFVEMKKKYDPKAILAPGQKIFTEPLE